MDRTGVAASAVAEVDSAAVEVAEADSAEAEADLTAVVATSMATMEGSESSKRPLFRLACFGKKQSLK